MLFNTNIFLYTFLPLFLLLYLSSATLFDSRILKNSLITLASLFFYYWGSGTFLFFFVASILVNYFLGYFLYRGDTARRPLLALGILTNLLLLGYFKYANFFYDQFSALNLLLVGEPLSPLAQIFLPIGISFYTFMGISYLVESYRRETTARDIVDFFCYMTMFPHLVAGPIVRYSEISAELTGRTLHLSDLSEGIWRFSIGMFKKVIFASTFGVVADKVFALPAAERGILISWLGALSYSFQIYFDFSGYSDMAVGLARMMGFHFPENFAEPYRAGSITEFWRRWHMSLSRWFRDFVYIPLGGNRSGGFRTYLNLALVFLLCGLWHGAAWHFVVWGLFHGALLIYERLYTRSVINSEAVRVGITFFLVIIGWVLFRAPTLGEAGEFYLGMFGLLEGSASQYLLPYFLDRKSQVILLASMVWIFRPRRFETIWSVPPCWRGIIALPLLFLAAVELSKSTFQPFIYFQF